MAGKEMVSNKREWNGGKKETTKERGYGRLVIRKKREKVGSPQGRSEDFTPPLPPSTPNLYGPKVGIVCSLVKSWGPFFWSLFFFLSNLDGFFFLVFFFSRHRVSV